MNTPKPPATSQPIATGVSSRGDRNTGAKQAPAKRLTLTLGSGLCQCPSCGDCFRSVTAFDMHVARGGRCLPPEEMREKGMVENADGWWLTSADPYRGPGNG